MHMYFPLLFAGFLNRIMHQCTYYIEQSEDVYGYKVRG